MNQLEDEEFVTLAPAYLAHISDDPRLLEKLRKNTRIIAHSDPAIASIARAMGLLAIVDVYTAKVALGLGGMVARPLVHELDYPIAVITRSTDSCSLAATALAEAFIEQLEVDRGKAYST